MEMVQKPVDVEAPAHVDLTGSSELTAANFDQFIVDHKVVMFSLSTCPYCFELKRTLAAAGISYVLIEVNKMPNRAEIEKTIEEKTQYDSYPHLFVNGKSCQGCDNIKMLERDGTFWSTFANADRVEVPDDDSLHSTRFFLFPEVVNRRAGQVSGLLAMIVCVLCVAFWKRAATKWVVLALAIDFTLRIIFGGPFSIIGWLSQWICDLCRLKPVFIAGPQKQFAALCGWFMSALSAALLLSGERLGGTIVIGALIGPTALEGFLDFCLGCWMFGYLISFGIVPKNIYRPYANLRPDKRAQYEFMQEQPPVPRVTEYTHVLPPGQTKERPWDLIKKERYEAEYKAQDVDYIRHTKIDFFGMPLALVALAFAFKLTYKENAEDTINIGTSWGTDGVYKAILITSVVLFGFIITIYFIRGCMYPKKVMKDFNHPVAGNMFSAVTICVTLYGILMFGMDTNFGITLVWMGAGAQMLITLLKIYSLAFEPIADDLINPSIMMAPVSNFVHALGFALYQTYGKNVITRDHDMNYIYIGRLWFSIAALFAIVFFTITFNKAIRDHHSEVRFRPMYFIWIATAAIAGPSYAAVSTVDVRLDVFYQCLWLIAVFFCVLTTMGIMKGFFTMVPDGSIWIYAFSYSALAISTLHYYSATNDLFMFVLSCIFLAVACWSCATCGAATLVWMCDGTWFKPKPKWGPVNFMKLFHEGFRHSGPALIKWSKTLDANSNGVAINDFLREFNSFKTAYLNHSNHEEQVLFPAIRRYFPHLNPSVDEEHHWEHAQLDNIIAAVNAYNSSPNADNKKALIAVFNNEKFEEWINHVLQHLRNEEGTISVAARKYVPLDIQKGLTDRCFVLTPTDDWEIIIPFLMQHLPNPNWKIQLLRCFLWANPARAQELGLILRRTVDNTLFTFLTQEMPELRPRGTCCWKRSY